MLFCQQNDADRPELYSPSEHFFNDIESSEVQLPGEIQKFLNRLKNCNSSESSPSPSASGTILETDPIVDAYKKSGDTADEDEDAMPEPSYSPPPGVVDDIEERVSPKEKEAEKVAAAAAVEIPEFIEEPNKSRDPRRKAAADSFRSGAAPAQPPPPGMEDEFSPPGVSKNETMMPEAGYTTMPAAPYPYATSQTIPPYTAMMPQMYLTTAPVYPQATALPFTAMPPPQLYVPTTMATMMHRTDPSLIPLPMEEKKPDKRKVDDEKETDSDEKKDKSKKHKSYYTSEAKANESRSSPPR